MNHLNISLTKPLHILLVDDQPIVRVGLMSLLAKLTEEIIFHEAGDESTVIALAVQHQPQIAVIDLSLAGSFTLDLIKNLRKRVPHMSILVVSMHDEMHYAERALRAGARGYVMKQRTVQFILQAVQAVYHGQLWLSDGVHKNLIERFIESDENHRATGIDTLSDRELSVFRMIGSGLKKSEIAKKLNLSPNTIETYRSHIKQKLGVASGGELMRIAFLQFQSTEAAALHSLRS